MNLILYHIALVISALHVVHSATRCYHKEGLGCFESTPMNALPQDPAHIQTTFTLSCRGAEDNVTIPAMVTADVNRHMLDASCFQAYRLTKIIVHGFTDSGQAAWVGDMRGALVAQDDVNVVVVDWHHGAQFPYVQTVANSLLVGRQVAHFIQELARVQGLSPALLHLIGHSAGAQVAGNAGGGVIPRVARVTALDPAEPYYGEMDDARRLDNTDADFVDVIHTDGERFTGFKGYGSLRTQGHVDFFPNGGVRQPGCDYVTSGRSNGPSKGPQATLACSHAFAIPLFIASIAAPPSASPAALTSVPSPTPRRPACSLTARPCASWDVYDAGNCTVCQGACPVLGLHVDQSRRGSYFLSTAAADPFCGTDYLVSVQMSSSQSHAYGRMHMTLNDGNSTSEIVDLLRMDKHFHASDAMTHVVTVTSDMAKVSEVKVRFTKGTGLSALWTSDILEVTSVNVTRVGATDSLKFCAEKSTQDTEWQTMILSGC